MPHLLPEPEVFKIPAAARIVGISPGSMRGLIRLGSVPTIRIGSRLMISRTTLDAIIAHGII